MSYSPLNNPPPYADSASEPAPREIPEDFKYDTIVSGCELSIRQQFIRKVYALLFTQLAVTTTVGALLCANSGVQEWCLDNQWLFYLSIFGSFGFMIGAYLQSRKYPVNLLFLLGFTLCESYIVGLATSLYDTNIVLQALGITLIIFGGMTLFAFQTKYDFTSWAGALYTALWMMVAVGFIQLFFPPSSTSELIYSGAGAILFSIYILVDTQMILKKFNTEEEVPAAIHLYLDVINLFLHILRILASRDD